MKYFITNNTANTQASGLSSNAQAYSPNPPILGGVTVWFNVDDGTNSFPCRPGESVWIDEDNLDMVTSRYPASWFTISGTDYDNKVPAQFKPSLTTAWTLVDLGKYCTHVQFQTATNLQVSFSGWPNAPTGNPATQYIIDVPASGTTPGDDLWEYDNQMNPFRQFYARASTGTITPTIIAY